MKVSLQVMKPTLCTFCFVIYLLFVLIAGAGNIWWYHTAFRDRTISAQKTEQNGEGGSRGLISGRTYVVAIFGTD